MSKEYADRPIGVFDSGQGGLTVLSRLVDLMPNEDYVFYGDSANAPYGVKSKEEVYQLAKRVVDELIDKHQVKAVMIACNTATSAAADRLRQEYSLPIIGIEPAVKPGGTLIYDGYGICTPPSRTDITVYRIDAMDAAAEMKAAKAFNMIVLGGLLKVCPLVQIDDVIHALRKTLPARHHDLIPMNEAALRKGMDIIFKLG